MIVTDLDQVIPRLSVIVQSADRADRADRGRKGKKGKKKKKKKRAKIKRKKGSLEWSVGESRHY